MKSIAMYRTYGKNIYKQNFKMLSFAHLVIYVVIALLWLPAIWALVDRIIYLVQYYQSNGAIEAQPRTIEGYLSMFTMVTLFLTYGPLKYSLYKETMMATNYEEITYGDVLSGFDKFSAAFFLQLVRVFYLFLWSILLIIPGIIKMLAYSMSYFLFEDNPGYSPLLCVTKSNDIMEGHKLELFKLYLSYFGWFILSLFTCGILLIWLVPQIKLAKYQFYLDLINNKENQ